MSTTPHHTSAPRLFDVALPDLTLEAGARVTNHLVRGWWWGPEDDVPWLQSRASVLSEDDAQASPPRVVRRGVAERQALAAQARQRAPARAPPAVPTVLLVHALTGDMRAGGKGGWWEPLIGPRRALDPSRLRLLCFNNLGSCYGTSGPADEGFPKRTDDARFGAPPPAAKGDLRLDEERLPATVTPWDQARSILLAMDALGLDEVELVTGGSLGGMVVLCLAALAPERFARLFPIATTESATAWVVGLNHVARQALLMDPGFPKAPRRGLELARQLAMLTYRAEPGLEALQGRPEAWSSRALHPMHSYLEYQGQKLEARFDARAYLAQLGAMDHHDLSRFPGGGLARIRASALCVGIDTDQLFFPSHMAALARRLRERGVHAEHATLSSLHGHDGFLLEWDALAALLGRALALPTDRGLAHAFPRWPEASARAALSPPSGTKA
ncbi:alpha/beta fold hydrolase [Corallococcus macrosporus]|uniref:Homoserine O-acetyltransferase n=1 Tax=Myxococcus fulvus (strain ATCC BAA-855 / HW-1) TaxID=483219 RepID=F8CMH6_MYXFH|nr:alpha/beta fold hydrolase [Corallococcus macrosporus]AEI65255.1 putative homoserine-O-acetyltransferase [Corallococcus macrosporus]